MPAGLHADADDNLYLAATYVDQGDTGWQLSKLSPGGALLWQRSGKSSLLATIAASATDRAGNTTIVGSFGAERNAAATIDFSGIQLTSNGEGTDIFVAQLDKYGAVRWARSFGAANANDAALAVSTSDDQIVVVGLFSQSLVVDSTTLQARGNYDAFLIKLDSAGQLIWAKAFAGLDNVAAQSVAIDRQGAVLIAGSFRGSASFAGTTLNSNGQGDVFAVKLDNAGQLQWVRRFGGGGEDGETPRIAVSPTGDAYLSATFEGAIDIDHTLLDDVGNFGLFIARLNGTDGIAKWAIGADGAPIDVGQLLVGPADSLYIAGRFGGTLALLGLSAISSGMLDLMVAKIDDNRSAVWLKHGGGTAIDDGRALARDSKGRVYVSGDKSRGPATFGPHQPTEQGAFIWRVE